MACTFDYEGNVKMLLPFAVPTPILASLFNINAGTIKLLTEDGNILEASGGKFAGLVGGRKYTVIVVFEDSAASTAQPQAEKVAPPREQVSLDTNGVSTIIGHVLNQSSGVRKRVSDLACVPQAANLINSLTVLAACANDTSLVNANKTAESFKYLTTPRSWKASLDQVSTTVERVFRDADRAMYRIAMNLEDMPTTLESAIEALCMTDDSGAVLVLEVNMKRLDDVSKLCANEAKKIVKGFDDALLVIHELRGAAIATKGCNEEESKKSQEAKLKFEADKARFDQRAKELKEIREKQKKFVDDAYKAYEEKAEKMGSLGVLVVALLTEPLIAGGQGYFGTDTAAASSPWNDIAMKVINLVSENQEKNKTLRPYELELLNLMEKLTEGNVLPLAEAIKVREERISVIRARIDVKAETDMGKDVKKKTKDYLKALKALDESNPKNYKDYEDAHNKVKTVCSVSRREYTKEQEKMEKKSKNLETTGTILVVMQNDVRLALDAYHNAQLREDELRKEAFENQSRITEMTSELAKIDVNNVNMDEIIKFLGKGMQSLSSLKDTWSRMAEFFVSMQEIISDRMKKNIDDFGKYVGKYDPNSAKIRKTILETGLKACGISLQVAACAKIYSNISEKFAMPVLSNASANFALDKEQAKIEFDKLKDSINSKNAEVKEFVDSQLDSAKEEASKQVKKYSEKYQLAINK